MKASVIISIYNNFERLEMVLAGFERQSVKDFEVILADDGSHEASIEAINAYRRISPLNLKHLWQEDKGFRKTTVLNKAIQAAKSDYLIFVDGDCIPHRHYVKAHLTHRQAGVILSGRRVNLSEKLTTHLSARSIRKGILEEGFLLQLMWDHLKGGTRDFEKGLYLPSPLLDKVLPQKFKGLLGCNFSLYKKDILDINGFDERYQAPAIGEDTDLELRLRWQGKTFKSIKNFAIQYHLYHPKLDRPSENTKILEGVQASRLAFTPFGIQKTADKRVSKEDISYTQA